MAYFACQEQLVRWREMWGLLHNNGGPCSSPTHNFSVARSMYIGMRILGVFGSMAGIENNVQLGIVVVS